MKTKYFMFLWFVRLMVIQAALSTSLAAQGAPFRVRPSLALGLDKAYGSIQGGANGHARIGVSFESVEHTPSVQLEASYYRSLVSTRTGSRKCPGCGTSREAAHEAGGLIASCQWNLRGSPGGPYLIGGLGGYALSPGGVGAVAVEVGVGTRRPQSGLYSDFRYVRLESRSGSGSLLAVVVGYRL